MFYNHISTSHIALTGYVFISNMIGMQTSVSIIEATKIVIAHKY